ncbi:MAG: hypothetical protein R3B09_10105 [Nannocystaceae bacterium]
MVAERRALPRAIALALALAPAIVLALAPARAHARPGDAAPAPRPRLMLAAGPMIGPRVPGEVACQQQGGTEVCEHTGRFFGVGGDLELRVQAIGPLYVQTRGILVGNAKPRRDRVHAGLGGVGLGLGAYSRLAFIRLEYLVLATFGPNTYRPPYTSDADGGRDVWGHSAGSLTGGVRLPAARRTAIELWVGLLVGPRSNRTSVTDELSGPRTIVSFTAGLGFSFDLIEGVAKPTTRAPTAPAKGSSAGGPPR